MSRWFRFYGDALNDPKVQSLPGDLFKTWVNLLCVASKHDGKLPVIRELTYLLRRRSDHLQRDLNTLVDRGLIDLVDDGMEPHNWSERQYKSDVSTGRVQQHRKRFGNVSKKATETAPDNRVQNTESEKEVRGARSRAGKPDGDPVKELEKVLDRTRAEAVVEHRRKIRKALTPHAASLLAGKFGRCRDPAAAADAMISNGWQGFEPEWLEGKPHGYRNGTGRSDLQLALDKARDFAARGDQEHAPVPEDEPAGRH